MIKFPTTKRVDLYKTAVSSEQLSESGCGSGVHVRCRENDDTEVVLKLIRKAIKKSRSVLTHTHSTARYLKNLLSQNREAGDCFVRSQHCTWRGFSGVRRTFLGICRNTSIYESKSSFG